MRTNNKISLIILLCILQGCSSVDKYAKNDHVGTHKIDDNLYVETYCIYRTRAYLTSDTYTCYLTDSTSFRLYLDEKEDYELIKVVPMNDSIIFVYKVGDNHIITNKKEYNLYSLKQEGKFE